MNMTELWRQLFDELNTQQQCMDMLTTAWIADYRAHGSSIFCGRGCAQCCTLAVNCTLTEAALLAPLLNDTQAAAVRDYAVHLGEVATTATDLKDYLRKQRSVMGSCPLLDADGGCGVYAARPLACRALLSTRESFFCGVDFADLSSAQKQEYIDSLDRSAVDFPLHYVASTRETAREFETRGLTVMRQQFGFSLYGAMPVLLHLVRDHKLAEAARNGREAAEAVAAHAGLVHPFTLEFSS